MVRVESRDAIEISVDLEGAPIGLYSLCGEE